MSIFAKGISRPIYWKRNPAFRQCWKRCPVLILCIRVLRNSRQSCRSIYLQQQQTNTANDVTQLQSQQTDTNNNVAELQPEQKDTSDEVSKVKEQQQAQMTILERLESWASDRGYVPTGSDVGNKKNSIGK